MNDSLDEVKARLSRLEKIMQDVQSQQQSMSANMPAGSGTGAPMDNSAPPANALPPASTTPAPGKKGKPSAGIPLSAVPLPAASATPAAPPVDDLYKTALGDYMGAKYQLASSEFSDVAKYYPEHALAGNASYYQGEFPIVPDATRMPSKTMTRCLNSIRTTIKFLCRICTRHRPLLR